MAAVVAQMQEQEQVQEQVQNDSNNNIMNNPLFRDFLIRESSVLPPEIMEKIVFMNVDDKDQLAGMWGPRGERPCIETAFKRYMSLVFRDAQNALNSNVWFRENRYYIKRPICPPSSPLHNNNCYIRWFKFVDTINALFYKNKSCNLFVFKRWYIYRVILEEKKKT